MKKCSNCGSELDDNATFCPFCGARQDGKITCVNCGKAIDANSYYCHFCVKDPKIK